MSVEILAFFRHNCPVPVTSDTRGLFEKALTDSLSSLEQFNLRGSVGDIDVVWERDLDELDNRAIGAEVTIFRRLDLPEMELFVSSGVAMLYLPILWFQSIQDTVRFERLVEMFRRMVVAFPVSEMVLTPFPLDPMANRAYDLVLKGKGFADAAK